MNQVQRVLFLLFIFSLLVSLSLFAQSSPQITAAELANHVKYLASDQLEGRKAGSKGAEAAAQYIANEFKTYGLKPIGDEGTYFQSFEIVVAITLGPNNTFAFTAAGKKSAAEVDKGFRPLGFSSSESFEGSLVFVGYGISDTAKRYDDYAGLDVSGKVVMVLRNAPPSDSTRNLNQHASLRYKASKARELGAKGLVVVTGPEDSDTDDLIKLTYDNSTGNAGILAVNVTRKVADELLKATATTVKDLQKEINKNRAPRSFSLPGVSVHVALDLKEIRQKTRNVIGMLEGSDPELKNQVIVIGAHYDHLGMGGEGSGSLKPDTVAIHHGADDNASGTAGLLELAQAFANEKEALKRSIVFISFTGEEMGLLGSGYYVNHAILPLARTVSMINMDMIGRLRNRTLIVQGVGTSPGFEAIANKHNKDSAFALRLNKDGFGPSDQSSFYAKHIPVFFFFTDTHPDYHLPSDTYDKINYQGMEKIVRYVEEIAHDLDQTSERPQYVSVESPRPATTGRSSTVTMGTIPDFGEQVQGAKIRGARRRSCSQGGDAGRRYHHQDWKG